MQTNVDIKPLIFRDQVPGTIVNGKLRADDCVAGILINAD